MRRTRDTASRVTILELVFDILLWPVTSGRLVMTEFVTSWLTADYDPLICPVNDRTAPTEAHPADLRVS